MAQGAYAVLPSRPSGGGPATPQPSGPPKHFGATPRKFKEEASTHTVGPKVPAAVTAPAPQFPPPPPPAVTPPPAPAPAPAMAMQSLQRAAPPRSEGWDAGAITGGAPTLGTRRPPAMDALLGAAGKIY